MGAKCVRFFVIIVCCLLGCIQSRPIEEQQQASRYGEIAPSQRWTRWTPLLALAFAVTSVLLVVGCVRCCRQLSGFEEFRNPESEWHPPSYNNSLAMTITTRARTSNVDAGPSGHLVNFRSCFLPSDSDPTRLVWSGEARLRGNGDDLSFAKDWLDERDFPRQQLHYVRECGQGWFGRVVEGEARGILPASNKVHRVVVRILKEDASAAEQAFFLQEAKPFKDLSHPNVLKLLGKCLENVPLLLVFETCSNGDLKSFLKQNTGNKEALICQGIMLRMSVDIASGLSYMLQNGFVHTDIAARNCLVTGDLRIKVGDYGTSLHTYKEEYYFNGDIALPIRWCAPETLNCTETTIEPKQVTGASCMWSFGVLLWELEEWGELPYRNLTDEQVIHRVFGAEGLRLPYPTNKTPYSQDICSIMTECWKDYIDRPSFIHVMNSISALLHRFKSNDFDARWYASKPNTVPVCDNDEKLRGHLSSPLLFSKCDNDSGIDLDNPAKSRRLHPQQSASRHQLSTDDFSSESPASSRRFSNSSTGDLFSPSLSSKLRSPSLENLHGSLSSLNRRADDVFEGAKVDFQLGLVSAADASILWNNKPLFQSDSYLEENSIMKRVCGVDSLGTTDAEEELWRKRIERGEFTEKVKEKSKSVADLMVLTHIDCSESSESDSLPSFHSRQSSFNRQCRRASAKALAAAASTATGPLSLLNSLSFGSESNLPVVEKDPEFQDALKKIQMAKMSGNEETVNFVSLHAMNSMVLGGRAEEKDGKPGHFLANEASEKYTTQSSQIMNDAFWGDGSGGDASPFEKTTKLPLLQLFEVHAADGVKRANAAQSMQELASDVEVSPCGTNDEFAYMSSCSSDNVDSVVIGPCESHTLEYFKGLKTTLVEQSVETKESSAVDANEHFASNPQTLNEFLSDASGDYFYKCAGDETRVRESQERATRSSYCDFCYQNECLRCRDRSVDENCSCESLENAEKCPFQSDDSGRGTDQINSGDGSSDKSLEGSISVQMNEVKNRLDVIAKFNTVADDASDDNCSSLEEDKEEEACEEIVIEELDVADVQNAIEVDLIPVVELAEAEEHSASADEDTCLDTVIDSSTSNKSAEGVREVVVSTDPADLSRSCESFSRSTNDLTYDVVTESESAEASPESEHHAAEPLWTETSPAVETPLDGENAAAYEISDILEGLSEPVSLSYSVNDEEEVDSEYEEDCIPSTWLPASLDDSSDEDGSAPRKRSSCVDQAVVEALRNELREKLPAVSLTVALSEDSDPERQEEEEPTTSADNTNIMMTEYNVYQAQLSPILEEDDEDAYSSFSSMRSAASSCEVSSASETINASTSCTFEGDDDDDLLMVNTETHEASLFAQQRAAVRQHNMNETYEIDENDDTIGLSDPLDSDSVATPDSLSPATSSKTSGAHLSYSSSDCGNLSDVFLSPSSSNKNFDELDMDRSPDDARLLNTPENTLRSADHQSNHQRTLFNMDEMLKRDFSQLGQALQLDQSQAPVDERHSPPWLRSFFRPANEVASLMSFHSLGDDEAEFRSLPADFKTECWPTVDELTSATAAEDHDLRKCADPDSDTSCTITEEVFAKTEMVEQAEMAEKVYVSENETSSSESSQNVSLKSGGEPKSPGQTSSTTKSKNSIALFGNGPKQIRNFYVSLVEDDSLLSAGKTTKSTESSYWSERLAVSSSADSKKTWKSPATIFGAFLGSPTFEGGAHALHEDTKEEDNANDMLMSTSFIESDSQGSSVDGKEEGALQSDDDSDEEGLESTSEEFVWKENNDTDIAQNDKTFSASKKVDGGEEDADDDDDVDDERLADFVPFAWNSDAIPKRSSLKAKDRVNNSNKKNVSFKKQKYHCVYEYPKEEPHYARIYDNMLQERMLSLWNAERDYLYNDYSSFSDWELDDCGEESPNQNNDDFAVSRGAALNSPRPAGIANKLSFYTIGACDSDPMKSDDSPIDYPNHSAAGRLESPSPSSSPYPAFASSSTGAAPTSPSGKYLSTDPPSPLDWSPVADHSNAVEPDTAESGDGTLSTLALGELKHTKNRLKLDLNNTITSYKSSTAEQQSKAKKYSADNDEGSLTSAEENDADDFVNEYAGLKFKPCDISPVVELKSLTSTSVA